MTRKTQRSGRDADTGSVVPSHAAFRTGRPAETRPPGGRATATATAMDPTPPHFQHPAVQPGVPRAEDSSFASMSHAMLSHAMLGHSQPTPACPLNHGTACTALRRPWGFLRCQMRHVATSADSVGLGGPAHGGWEEGMRLALASVPIPPASIRQMPRHPPPGSRSSDLY